MYYIGIDVGSTFTKYCIMDSRQEIVEVFSEPSPIRQKEYFFDKVNELSVKYPEAEMVSCGYGRNNVPSIKCINELTALARGSFYQFPEKGIVLDVGGQDTKIIRQEEGKLKEFFVNEKCAAGCGMFLSNTLNMLQKEFREIDLRSVKRPDIMLSSVCAVFAQSEIVELIAADVEVEKIIQAVLWQILTQAKALLGKVEKSSIVLSGGLTQVPGIDQFAGQVFECRVIIPPQAAYLSAIGCACICSDTAKTKN